VTAALPERAFDCVINCSSIEHVGLGGRYGSTSENDGDLVAMKRLRSLMTDEATMLLTVPVGKDAVFAPRHRIYGSIRLPKLLDGLEIASAEYWKKAEEGQRWSQVPKDEALAFVGSEDRYALGLFVLTPGKPRRS
jgi:hypothetical protein